MKVRRGHAEAYIVVTPNPWDQRAVRTVVPTSEEQGETQATILDFKQISCLWRDGLRPVPLGGRFPRTAASHTGDFGVWLGVRMFYPAQFDRWTGGRNTMNTGE